MSSWSRSPFRVMFRTRVVGGSVSLLDCRGSADALNGGVECSSFYTFLDEDTVVSGLNEGDL